MPPPGANTRFSRTLRNALSHSVLHRLAVCERLSCAAERAFSPCGKARFMPRYGASGTAIRSIPQYGKAFSVLHRHIFPRPPALKRLPDTLFPAPYLLFPAPSVSLSPFPVVKSFYSLKRINIHLLTARQPRHTLSVVLRLHIFPRPPALKRLPATPFPAPYLLFPVPSVPLSPFLIIKTFFSRKGINLHFLTLSPPHPLTLLYVSPVFPVPAFSSFPPVLFRFCLFTFPFLPF